MKISRSMLVLAFLIASTLIGQEAKVTPVMSKDLAELSGKEGVMITVVYPPSAAARQFHRRRVGPSPPDTSESTCTNMICRTTS